ncbi:MAG: hypothetical protein KDJ36_02325 [Hyphomicrobiaceae bacterium]|nr:hypothetical protein [Hyphomicrobiaceae bacterium]
MKRSFLALFAGALALPIAALASLIPVAAHAATLPYERISGPHAIDNLAVFFLHGRSQPGPVPLTLAEAMAAKVVTVFETGRVNQLVIQNTGDREVFVQAGDIVKGGRQDRVLAVSLVLAPKSAPMPIGVFCVEQGRWRKRGVESVRTFHSVGGVLPSRAAKIAMLGNGQPRRPVNPTRNLPYQQRAGGVLLRQHRSFEGGSQTRLWQSVGAMQDKLSRNLKVPVRSKTSSSSLPLSLETSELVKARRRLIDALKAKTAGASDIVGAVFVINGRIQSADAYPSNGLFGKLWPRLLAAAATEAIAEKHQVPRKLPPSSKDVRAFLLAAQSGERSVRKIDSGLIREAHDAKGKAVTIATRRSDGRVLHRTYVAY